MPCYRLTYVNIARAIVVLSLTGPAKERVPVSTRLGVYFENRKHVLGLWARDTENAEVCGQLVDELIERGLTSGGPSRRT